MKETGLGGQAVRGQEIAFSICMGLVAVVCRDNPILHFPQILWAFASLLVFNLGFHFALRKYGHLFSVPLVSNAVNILLVTVILRWSGGRASSFWPMYLLPLFTACLYLEPRHVIATLVVDAAFLSYFYIEPLWIVGASWDALELFAKLTVLTVAAGVTLQVSSKERLARSALGKSREELDRLARSTRIVHPIGKMGPLMGGILHEFNNKLMVILGSTEVMMMEVPDDSEQRRDLERIKTATSSLGRLTGTLLKWSRKDGGSAEEIELDKLVMGVLVLLDHKLKRKNLTLLRELSSKLPKPRLSQALVQQAILDLLLRAADRSPDGGRIVLRGLPADEGLEVRISYPSVPDDDPTEGLEAAAELLESQGGTLATEGANGHTELVAHLPAKIPTKRS